MKRIVLFFDRPYIEAHFCFKEIALQFAKNNCKVYLFYLKSLQLPDFIEFKNIICIPFSYHKRSLLKLLFQLLTFKIDIVVATPQWAIYWAYVLKKIKPFKLVYLSDEVFANNPEEFSIAQQMQPVAIQKKWKKREILAHQHCDATIALGEDRYHLLKKINGLKTEHPYFAIPNSPSEGYKHAKYINYYKGHFNFSNDDVILLHSGGLGWTLIQELNETTFPEKYKIVLQTRRDYSEFTLQSSNIYISNNFFSYNDIISVTSGANIGLMLYDESNAEEKRNGNTAGKLGLYLAAGIPIIAGNLKSFQWIEDEEIGIRIEKISHIPEATDKIMRDYSKYKKNVENIFKNKFEYTKQFEPLKKWLQL